MNKKLLILSLGLVLSLPSFASYHEGEGGGSGGYGDDSSSALALVAVGVIAYVVYKNRNKDKKEEFTSYLKSKKVDSRFEVSFDNKNLYWKESNYFISNQPQIDNKFFINFRFKIN